MPDVAGLFRRQVVSSRPVNFECGLQSHLRPLRYDRRRALVPLDPPRVDLNSYPGEQYPRLSRPNERIQGSPCLPRLTTLTLPRGAAACGYFWLSSWILSAASSAKCAASHRSGHQSGSTQGMRTPAWLAPESAHVADERRPAAESQSKPSWLPAIRGPGPLRRPQTLPPRAVRSEALFRSNRRRGATRSSLRNAGAALLYCTGIAWVHAMFGTPE